MNDIVARLKRILSGAEERGLDETECRAIRDASDEIERLRDERDEARRRCCQLWAADDRKMSPQDYAEECGWDCFKENT